MRVEISREHIEKGKCQIPQKCMIAAAIRESDPSISYVAVRTNGITVTKRKKDGGEGVREHWAVPLKAARAIIKFDAGEEVEPFSFVAKMIDKVVIPSVPPEKAKKGSAITKKRRAKLKAKGLPPPVYGRRTRIAGV